MSNSTPVGPLVFLGDPNVGNTLTARPNGIADADGINSATETFQWFRNGQPISGATNQLYTLTAADQGAGISVSYSYLDFGGTRETVDSKSKTVLAAADGGGTFTPPIVTGIEPIPTPNNSAPEGPLTILGDVLVGETLIARPNAVIDADGINGSTKKFQWLRDGDVIPGATDQSYVVTDADRGSQISVLYTYFDNGGSFEVVASKPEPIVPGGTTTPPVVQPPVEEEPVEETPVETPTPPTGFMNSVPIGKLVILGFPVEGADLWARTDAVFDRDGFNPANARFQWLRDGEPIPGATANTYRITEDDRGASLSVQMSFVDGAGTLETVFSDPEPAVPDPDAREAPTSPQEPEQPEATGVLEGTPEDDAALIATSEIGRIDGLDGVDTAVFAGDQSNYTLVFSPDGITVTDRTDGGLGTIALDNVELIDFGTELPVFGGAMDLRQFGGHTALDQETFESFVEMLSTAE